MSHKLRPVAAGVLLLGLLIAISGCATFSAKTGAMRDDYGRADFTRAEAALDRLIAAEARVDMRLVTDSKGLSPKINPARGDTGVLLLEKAMLRLAQNDPESAVKLLRRGRDLLDANFSYDTSAFFRDVGAVIADDTVRKYSGADYEHIMVRAMLAVADLISGGGDAFAYAVQIGETQERIIGSPLGEVKGDKGYRPRERYRRVGFGAYVQGLIREDKLIFDEAERAYRRAVDFEGGNHPVYGEALKRVTDPVPSEAAEGVLEVFDFAGRGPHLVENIINPTTESLRLAGIMMLAMKGNVALITQSLVPIPAVYVSDPNPPGLLVEAAGRRGETRTVLDVNRIAREQNEANMPWTVARAVARRAVKAVASEAIGEAVGAGVGRKKGGEAVKDLTTIATSVVLTATENADTRSWTTLPSQIRVGRLELPPGVHRVRFGSTGFADVRIAAGHTSYVLIIRPDAAREPAIVVDRYSRP